MRTRRFFAVVSALMLTGYLAAGEDSVNQALQEELERLGAARKAPGYKEFKTTPARLKVLPVDVPKDYVRCKEEFPKSSHDVTVGPDGNFVRDGKPVFLTGVEAEMYNGAWLHRILNIDFTELSILAPCEFRNSAKVEEKKGPDGKLLLEFSTPAVSPWLELRIKEALRGGTLLTYEHMFGRASFWPLSYQKYSIEPPFYCPGVPGFRKNSSHMLDLCMENPEAREMYLNVLRWNARLARSYPVWMYELVNEVSYFCPCLTNTKRFQAEMARKYGDIAKANQTWGTAFASFEKVLPPMNIEGCSIYNSRWGTIPCDKELSVPLWIDWARWMESRVTEVFKELRDDMRKTDPQATCTIQSPYWQGRNAQQPASKAPAEDIFGSEHCLALFRQTAGSEQWAEIRQMFDQQLANDLVATAVPAKPSVNLECVINGYPRNKENPPAGYIIGAAGMRTFFWHQAVHGVGGSVISYFYDNQVSEGGGSVWDLRRMSLDAVREMPRTKNEILSLAEIVLPRPRIKGRIGVLYSYETARIIRPEEKDIWQKFVPEVLDYYAPAVLTRVPVAAITSRQVLEDKLGGCKLIVLPHAFRVPPGFLEKLTTFVKAGGTVLASPPSLRFDDELGGRLNTDEFLGGHAGAPVLKPATLAFEGDAKSIPGGATSELFAHPSGEANFEFASTIHGYEFAPAGAKVLAQADGKPAFTVNSLGAGKVYFLACEPNPVTRRALIDWVVAQCGLKPDVNVVFTDELGAKADYVETHRFQKDKRAVLYALNFGGGPRNARLVPADNAAAPVAVRDVRSGSYLAPDGRAVAQKTPWTPEQYAAGVPVALPSQDPVVLLVEDAAGEALALRKFTAEQEEVLKWLYRPSPKSDKRVLIDAAYVLEGRMHVYRMPTAVKLLEDAGYQVDSLAQPLRKPLMRNGDTVSKGKLADYRVLVLAGSHGRDEWEKEDIDAVVEFVQNGGGLLCCPPTEYHSGKPQKVLEAFGLTTAFANFYDTDPQRQLLGEPLYANFTDVTEHPVTKDVKIFQPAGAIPVRIANNKTKATVLLKGSATSYTMHPWGDTDKSPGQAVAVAAEFGKGRVVVIGGDSWLRPDDFARGDNQKLFANAIEWLAAGGK